MKIIIITQNDPFFLSENIKYLYHNLPNDINIEGVILSNPSPFGRKEKLIKKALKTIKIFGINFFIFYSIKFLISKLFRNNLDNTLRKLGVKIIKLQKSINDKESLDLIKSYKPDLLVSILGNEIFKKDLIQLAKFGCINLHSSLLPKYRGLMPTFWVLRNNEKYTGVSVFFVDEGIDSGPIIMQRKILIGNSTHYGLIKKTKKIGMDLILIAITKIKNKDINLVENMNSKKSYYSFPTRSDIKIFINSGKKFF